MSSITFELPGFEGPLRQQQGQQGQQRQQQHEEEEQDALLATTALLAHASAAEGRRGTDARRRGQRDCVFGKGGAHAAAAEEDEDEDEDGFGGRDDLHELLLPWHCSSCTLRNESDRLACEACGLVNKRRERLRARGEEERRSVMERRAEQQKCLADRIADLDDLEEEVIVMADDDDEDDGAEGRGSTRAVRGEEGDSDAEVVLIASPVEVRRPTPAEATALDAAPASPLKNPSLARHRPMLLRGASPFEVLPVDMVLHALAFLQDPVVYSDLRTLSRGWSRIAEHESLWRPLAEARFKPPPPPPMPASQRRTPTPTLSTVQASSSSSSSSSAAAGGGGGPRSGGSSARRESLGLPASWSCTACGLLQADRFGLHCEFCSKEREIVTASPMASAGGGEGGGADEPPPSCFRVIKTYDELAEIWRSTEEEREREEGKNGKGGAAAAEGGAAERPLYSEEKKRKADEAALEASSRLMSGPGSTPEGHARAHLAGTGPKNVWAVAGATGDYYYLFKLLVLEEALAGKWDSLHRGYEWLVNSARAALRTRLYATREQIVQRDDSLISIPESFQRVVNKLTARNWPLLFECFRAELDLQAEALRRDMLRHLREASAGGAGTVHAGYRRFLQEVLRAFQAFGGWAFEVCAFFGKLNDQISGERFRVTTSTLGGCGVVEGPATPYVSELALLGFRDRFLQHWAVRTALLGAIEGDADLSLATLWGPGGDHLAAAAAHSGGGGSSSSSSSSKRAAGAAACETGVEPEESAVDRRVLLARAGAAGAERRREEEGRRRRVVQNVADLLRPLGKMCEELDVPEGVPAEEGAVSLGSAFRRYVLRPLRDTLAEIRVDGVGPQGPGEGEDDEEGVMGVGGSLKEGVCGGGGGGERWCRGFRRQRQRGRDGIGDGVERLAKRMRLV